MKRQLIVFLFFVSAILFVLPAQAQVPKACEDISDSAPLAPFTAADSTEHSGSDLHSVTVFPIHKCTYAHGKQSTCDTFCNIDPLGATAVNPLGGSVKREDGHVIIGGSHDVSGGWVSGSGHGFGSGASCTAQMVAGAANCGALGVKCIISVTVAPGGATVSTAPGSTVVWRSPTGSITGTCPSIKDPTTTTQGGGSSCGSTCDPCLNSVTVGLTQGPTGSFTHTGGSGGPTDPTCSPIIIDTEGEGFQLTSYDDGVMFDIRGDGHPIKLSWTARGSHNAFLALDRDGSGSITSGKELFGNFTKQPNSTNPNGFLALAEFDKPENGGNGDGVIDERDAVFAKLRLWIDGNHDGVAELYELHTLPELGVYSLALNYHDSRKQDQYGNQFRYKARVNPGARRDRRDESEVDRWAYDVFFVTR